jgi:hypothetical protein
MHDMVSCHTANEPGEFLRLSHASLSDLFNDGPEYLLIEVVSDRRVTYFPANDNFHATTVTLDQFDLGLPLASLNTANKVGPASGLICDWSFHSLTLTPVLHN